MSQFKREEQASPESILRYYQSKQPIKFIDIKVRIFVDFLHSRARGIDTDRNFLSKSASESYRSAFKDLYHQCGVTMNEDFEKKFENSLQEFAGWSCC